MHKKADKARDHGEQLKRDRQVILDRIAGYHRYIDSCTQEMSKSVHTEYLVVPFYQGTVSRG